MKQQCPLGGQKQTTVARSFYDDVGGFKDVEGTWLSVLVWDDFQFQQQ